MKHFGDRRRCVEVVHVGPGPRMQGGIAVAIERLMCAQLSEPIRPTRYSTVIAETGMFRHVRGILASVAIGLMSFRQGRRIYHLHTSVGGSFWRKALIQQACRWSRTPVVVHIHGSSFDTYAESGSRFRRRCARAFLRHADRVVVLSSSWARWVEEFAGVSDAAVIPNPVHLSDCQSTRPAPPVVVFAGRLGARKGIPELLEAIAILHGQQLPSRWVLMGDGDVEAARSWVSSRSLDEAVTVTGWMDQDGVHQWLEQASIFCLPSHAEGLPLALLEAMACAVVPVITPVGGMPELIRDGVEGVVVEVGDVPQLANKLGELIRDAEQCAVMGARAKERVVKLHSPTVIARALDHLYAQLIQERFSEAR